MSCERGSSDFERGNNVLDCGHAAAVPGGFDGELVALFDVLDEFEFAS